MDGPQAHSIESPPARAAWRPLQSRARHLGRREGRADTEEPTSPAYARPPPRHRRAAEADRSRQSLPLALADDDADTLHCCFDRLSAGGTVGMPLVKQVWRDEYGQLTHQFNIECMVNISG